MSVPDQLLLSDLLRHRVRCDQGLDHGLGVMAWMHPPVHRLLGWVSRPSALRLSRNVWRLNQCRGLDDQQVFVKGFPAEADQITLDRLPTLMEAHLLNAAGERVGIIADLAFRPANGQISHYLVARSDPRLPGSSRWRLSPDRILDQQPGLVFSGIHELDDLPLARASVRQDFLQRSRQWREQLQHFGDRAGERLEGWLEEPPWDEAGRDEQLVSERGSSDRSTAMPTDGLAVDPLDDWDEDWPEVSQHGSRRPSRGQASKRTDWPDQDEDPWV